MNLIEFIFALLARYVPIEQTKFLQLKKDGETWYAENIEVEKPDQPVNFIVKIFREHAEKWYFKTGLAVLFIFAVRWVRDFMNGVKEGDPDNGNTFF